MSVNVSSHYHHKPSLASWPSLVSANAVKLSIKAILLRRAAHETDEWAVRKRYISPGRDNQQR